MSGSDASILGYGNITPGSNVNGHYVNLHNSNYSGNFSSNEVPGLPGLAGAKYNVDAAKGYVPGICLTGGAKKLKRKIKNITKHYKMKSGKRAFKKHVHSLKKKITSKYASLSKSLSKSLAKLKTLAKTKSKALGFGLAGGRKRRHTTRKQRGGMIPPLPGNIPYPAGYGQYQNNLPMTPTYSVGGLLKSSELGLANPPPIKLLSNNTNGVDNYNHYTNKGFASRGH